MLDREPNLGKPLPLICLRSVKPWREGAASRSYRLDMTIAGSRYRHAQAVLTGAGKLQRRRADGMVTMLLVAQTGCATQETYPPASPEVPEVLKMPAAEAAIATQADEDLWRQLNDPTIDTLVEPFLDLSPSIVHTIARVCDAHPLPGATAAKRVPSVHVAGRLSSPCSPL
ncbi:hypothetical protein SAMN04515620_12639 [Collimonas sp. OK607]|nr:hypothetical protein SAMN04515620_12639 [Collimonas sp. OK607]